MKSVQVREVNVREPCGRKVFRVCLHLLVVLGLLSVALCTIEIWRLRWYHYAIVAMDGAEPQDRFEAAVKFNWLPSDRGQRDDAIAHLPHLVWKNVLFTGPSNAQRHACSNLALDEGVDGIMSVQCLVSIAFPSDSQSSGGNDTHAIPSARYGLVNIYASDRTVVKEYMLRRIRALAKSGNTDAHFFLAFDIGDPGYVWERGVEPPPLEEILPVPEDEPAQHGGK